MFAPPPAITTPQGRAHKMNWLANQNPAVILAFFGVISAIVHRIFDLIERKSTPYITDKHWDYIREAYDTAIKETRMAVLEERYDGRFRAQLLDKMLVKIAEKWLYYNEGGTLPESVAHAATAQILEAIDRAAAGEVGK